MEFFGKHPQGVDDVTLHLQLRQDELCKGLQDRHSRSDRVIAAPEPRRDVHHYHGQLSADLLHRLMEHGRVSASLAFDESGDSLLDPRYPLLLGLLVRIGGRGCTRHGPADESPHRS